MLDKDSLADILVHHGLDEKEARLALEEVLTEIMDTVARGGEVNLRGFGKFELAHRSARKGVSVQTLEPVQVRESWTPRFKCSSVWKKKCMPKPE